MKKLVEFLDSIPTEMYISLVLLIVASLGAREIGKVMGRTQGYVNFINSGQLEQLIEQGNKDAATLDSLSKELQLSH